jgi:hypothetical protein
VLEHLSEGRGMLKLPKGAFQISRLPVVLMKQNRFGAVRVEGGPGFAAYGIGFHRANSLSGAPTQTDLTVPHKERPAVLRVAKNLGLQGSSPEEFLKKLTVFFRKEFRYSLGPNPVGNRETHLADFLLNTRSGHCECFATATVLLLRAAGIPARYAVGYSVHEWSELEQRFVVRARHAHAWALAYVKGAWQDVDTTPPDWTRMEEEAASPMQRLYDAWSWVMLKVSQWRWQGEKGSMTRYLPWLLAPLILVLTWRVLRKKPIRRLGGKREEPALGPETSGADSEFYGIERKLNQWGYARPPWETLSGWIHGLKQDPVLAPTLESLDPVLALHYRYRFHPNGITEQERQELTAAVQAWLAERETRQESH